MQPHEGPATGPEAKLRIATANVQYTLGIGPAREALTAVIDPAADLVALQEWYPSRWPLLRERGRIQPVPAPRWLSIRARAGQPSSHNSFSWAAHLVGGCVVGARSQRFDLVSCRSVLLTWPGRAERPDRFFGVEPPRYATVAVFNDHLADRSVALMSYHLVAGVQKDGVYRADRPRLTERHRHEVGRLVEVVDRLRAAGHQVYAAGDGNFHGLGLPSLKSTWEGRDTHRGTLGAHRRIDDIHGPSRPESVRLIETASDHAAVVATFKG